MASGNNDFYLKYYAEQRTRLGDEFSGFEFLADGQVICSQRDASNNIIIQQHMHITSRLLNDIKRYVINSGIFRFNDRYWPPPNYFGSQVLEIIMGDEHTTLTTCSLDRMLQLNLSHFPPGLRRFYALLKRLKDYVFVLIVMNARRI